MTVGVSDWKRVGCEMDVLLNYWDCSPFRRRIKALVESTLAEPRDVLRNASDESVTASPF